ncbi:formate dehydrogenase [Azospirillum sp. TSO22-1]|uniref:formate dehydrogenase n=1 Tax=Azospirillum sp. TSO22-1 TaxID=716789 RepID=UPI000D60F1AB|nr:formate dehydrogenase [Azospirillum sp. TSO22-1]PWC55284.1 formate dehydrogenase [Azospirillum sp. TSO22-1]
MTNTNGKATLARRDLFRAAGLGAGALGAAAVGLPAAPAEARTDDDRTAQRYRETEHVRKAYESSRF